MASPALIAEFSWSMSLHWQVLLVRVLASMFLTGLIGIERESSNSAAGFRTHMLVGLAATIYSLITLELVADNYDQKVSMDPIRMVEAVTSGVAFLAAGMIVFSKGEVRGLTTGASLWLAASIGLAMGLGLWPLAVGATVLGLVVVRLSVLLEYGKHKDE